MRAGLSSLPHSSARFSARLRVRSPQLIVDGDGLEFRAANCVACWPLTSVIRSFASSDSASRAAPPLVIGESVGFHRKAGAGERQKIFFKNSARVGAGFFSKMPQLPFASSARSVPSIERAVFASRARVHSWIVRPLK